MPEAQSKGSKVIVEKILLLIFGASFMLVGCAKNRPTTLGVNNGQLAPCPDSPNCVSSQSSDKRHSIEPIICHGISSKVFAKLKSIIKSTKRTEIVKETHDYLHVEFRSALFGFVDDVEFHLNEENKLIHVRSASRTGYWDLGANRRRIENIRAKLSGN
jgi:uncharacterized protein (DUF1499 family)